MEKGHTWSGTTELDTTLLHLIFWFRVLGSPSLVAYHCTVRYTLHGSCFSASGILSFTVSVLGTGAGDILLHRKGLACIGSGVFLKVAHFKSKGVHEHTTLEGEIGFVVRF